MEVGLLYSLFSQRSIVFQTLLFLHFHQHAYCGSFTSYYTQTILLPQSLKLQIANVYLSSKKNSP